jgi:hypothetical protein
MARTPEPASGVIEGISSIGFIGLFAFMLSTGVVIMLGTTRDSPSTFNEGRAVGVQPGTTSGSSRCLCVGD